MQVTASVYSQNTLLSLSMKNSTLKEVFREIEKQSEFTFLYNDAKINVNKEVSVDFQSGKVEDILNQVLNGTGIAFVVIDKQVVLAGKDQLSSAVEAAQQQERKVTGKVTDQAGVSLPGVSIVVKGTTNGTITDANGNYSLTSIPENETLQFSFVGMKTQEIAVGNETTVNVVLAEETIGLEEVVTIGYGTQKKSSLTGSVINIAAKDIMASPAQNIANSLSGLMPGVITKMTSGEPGRDVSEILIRGRNTIGNNSPLIVIDGVIGRRGWATINPYDIESISILKDASAAIYGAQAANGVILITTKRGKTGKPTLSYTFNQGITKPTRIPKMASSALYGEFINELLVEKGQQPRYTADELQKFRDGSDPLNYPNTNWLKEVLKPHSSQSQHNLSVRGGSENIKYSVSGSFSDQDGIFKNGITEYKTYSIRSNLDAQVNKNIKVFLDITGAKTDALYPAFGTGTTFQFARINFPYQPVFYPNGLPSSGLERGNNPAIMPTEAGGYNSSKNNLFQSKVGIDIALPWVKGLSVDGFYAYDMSIGEGKIFNKPWIVYDYNKATDQYIPKPGGNVLRPDLLQSTTNSSISLMNARVRYEKRLSEHNFSAFIAGEQSLVLNNSYSGYRKNYISTSVDQLFAGDVKDMEATGTAAENARRNIFGRLSYGFKKKYLFDFNFRYDGSSNFPEGNRYGFFPGVSAAWRISQEDFVNKALPFVSDLKLRASWGKIGNDQIPAFQFISAYSFANGYNLGQIPTPQLGLTRGVTPNLDITWEVAQTTNIGLDGELWKGLLSFTVDVFKTKRSNILIPRNASVPVFTGLRLPNENIGIVENKGIELELSHRKTINKFSYRVGGNIAYNQSNVIDIDEPSNVPDWQRQAGHIINAENAYRAIGIFRTQAEVDKAPKVLGTKVGDLQYEDVNKDGVITSLDMVRLDMTNTPQVVFGINMSVSYKNLSLYALFQGQSKAYQFFFTRAGLNGNSLEELLTNRYTPGSMDSKYPRIPALVTEVSGLRSDFWLRDASYVRLKTLELSYTIPQSILSGLKITGLRFYLNGSNLITIDKLKIFDPEGNNESGDFYPQNKIFNVGFNLSF